jgi:hypothetical protein
MWKGLKPECRVGSEAVSLFGFEKFPQAGRHGISVFYKLILHNSE